jgi:hypothetical protein
MSLLDEIQAARLGRGTVCSVTSLRETLDPTDRAHFDEALADPTVSAAAIARAVNNRGHKIGQYAIGRHRRRDCTCESR